MDIKQLRERFRNEPEPAAKEVVTGAFCVMCEKPYEPKVSTDVGACDDCWAKAEKEGVREPKRWDVKPLPSREEFSTYLGLDLGSKDSTAVFFIPPPADDIVDAMKYGSAALKGTKADAFIIDSLHEDIGPEAPDDKFKFDVRRRIGKASGR